MKRCPIWLILLVAVILRLGLLYVHTNIMTLPAGGGDEARFEAGSWMTAVQGRGNITEYLTSGADFIVLIGSYIYSIFGRTPFMLGLLMVVLGTAVVFVAYKAALELWDDVHLARMVAWATALFPQLAMHSALFLREIPVSLCLVTAALYIIRYVKHNDLRQIIGFSVFIFLGALFHNAILAAIPAALLGIMLARPKNKNGRLKYYLINIAATVVLGVVVYVANSTGYGMHKLGGGLDTALETFEQGELRDTRGSAAFPEWMRIRGGLNDIWKVPARLTAFLFAPLLPFMVKTGAHLLGAIDGALYLYLFWQIFRNWETIKNRRAAIIILVIVLILYLAYSLGVSNFGTAIRHRAKMAPLLLLLAAVLPEIKRRQIAFNRRQKLKIRRAKVANYAQNCKIYT